MHTYFTQYKRYMERLPNYTGILVPHWNFFSTSRRMKINSNALRARQNCCYQTRVTTIAEKHVHRSRRTNWNDFRTIRLSGTMISYCRIMYSITLFSRSCRHTGAIDNVGGALTTFVSTTSFDGVTPDERYLRHFGPRSIQKKKKCSYSFVGVYPRVRASIAKKRRACA